MSLTNPKLLPVILGHAYHPMAIGRREQDRLAYMPFHRAFNAPLTVLMSLARTSLAGCTYEQEGPPEAHFETFDAKPPKVDTVSVCHAYGCKEQTPFTFSQADIAELSALMARVPRNDSPAEERRAIAYSVAWMERRVAPTVGTATDRPSMDFGGSGDPTQQDCVDEATNTTSYLLVLERHWLLRHHTVERPFAKDSLVHWRPITASALPSAHLRGPTARTRRCRQRKASMCPTAGQTTPRLRLGSPPSMSMARLRRHPKVRAASPACSNVCRPWATPIVLPDRHDRISAG